MGEKLVIKMIHFTRSIWVEVWFSIESLASQESQCGPSKPDAIVYEVFDAVFHPSGTLCLLLHKSNMGSICLLTYLLDESDLREIGDD